MKQTMLKRDVYILLEVLNQSVFTEVQSLLPDTYVMLGVVQQPPYFKTVTAYERGIKNYLLLPNSQQELLTAALEN
jgi:hypothetical protein